MTFSIFSIVCMLASLLTTPQISFENSYIQLLPFDLGKCSTEDINKYITFSAYSRQNPFVERPLRIGDDTLLAKSRIDFNLPTIVYFHAFFEDANTMSSSAIKNAYVYRGDHNVIMVSARQLLAGPWYLTAVRNTQIVGLYTAKLLMYLMNKGLNPKMTHMIGHSLGAQAAGVAGHALGKWHPARITGLDPALPFFPNLPLSLRLDRSDADFVDIIHSDAGGFGISAPMGHADFYINGGKSPQPGCELKSVLPRKMLLLTFFCSHWLSFQIYAESVIRPDAFPSVPCGTGALCKEPNNGKILGPIAYLGFGLSPLTRGRFYVKTTAEAPYSYYLKRYK